MRFKIVIFFIFLSLLKVGHSFSEGPNATESDQQINDFSLAGYGEKGVKSWDLAGKSADIFTEVIKLKDVVGNLYGQDENTNLVADRGDFNKTDGRVHLEQNVVITTSSGTKLTTDSLDWDRKNQLVTTEDVVNIQRDNMVTVGRGAKGEPNLKKVSLEKEVQVDINPAQEDKPVPVNVGEKMVITCDGPLEVDYASNIATFKNNVKVERPDSTIYSDIMDIYFSAKDKEKKDQSGEVSPEGGAAFMGTKIDKIVAKGNVKIVRGENISYSEEAVYTAFDKKIVLTGRPKLIIYSTEDLKDASSGD